MQSKHLAADLLPIQAGRPAEAEGWASHKKNQAGGPKERQPGEGEREQDHLRHGSLEFVSYFRHSRIYLILYIKDLHITNANQIFF